MGGACCSNGCGGGGGRYLALVVGVGVAIGAGFMATRGDKKAQPEVAVPVLPVVQSTSTPAAPAAQEQAMDERYVLGYTMNAIDGESVDLAQYKGSVVLIVNTASECGLTGQYAGLEKLYMAHKDAGLVVLGFPANNFGNQEPGTDAEIATFCTTKFNVTFPMFAKISVKGDDAHPLYRQLTKLSEEPTWNFTKYLVDREGRFSARFDPRTTPDDPKLTSALESLLAPAPR